MNELQYVQKSGENFLMNKKLGQGLIKTALQEFVLKLKIENGYLYLESNVRDPEKC